MRGVVPTAVHVVLRDTFPRRDPAATVETAAVSGKAPDSVWREGSRQALPPTAGGIAATTTTTITPREVGAWKALSSADSAPKRASAKKKSASEAENEAVATRPTAITAETAEPALTSNYCGAWCGDD